MSSARRTTPSLPASRGPSPPSSAGVGSRSRRRAQQVAELLGGVVTHCLGRNLDGSARHPLELAASARLAPYILVGALGRATLPASREWCARHGSERVPAHRPARDAPGVLRTGRLRARLSDLRGRAGSVRDDPGRRVRSALRRTRPGRGGRRALHVGAELRAPRHRAWLAGSLRGLARCRLAVRAAS